MELQPQQRLAQLRRPNGRQPPDDRRLDHRHKLDIESLESLGPHIWLENCSIDTFLRSLCLAQPGRCVTFDSTTLRVLLSQLESEQAATVVDEFCKPFRTLAATVTGNRGLVFMPFCVDFHWVLAVADFENRIIRVYDSMVSCDRTGKVNPSELVKRILPCVKATLSFCIDEDQWPVEHMWLPIRKNYTECGTYICLMALQHAYMPGFKTNDYVTPFPDENSIWSYYELDACYWLVGRKIILEVCSRYFKPTSTATLQTRFLVEQKISQTFQHLFSVTPAGARMSWPIPYFHARSKTLSRVRDALTWAIDSIDRLGSIEHVHLSETIQNKAREVILTPAGEPFLNEIVGEAVSYAWHDTEALRNLGVDLNRARDHSDQEHSLGRYQLNAWAAHLARMAGNTEQTPGPTAHGSSSSPANE